VAVSRSVGETEFRGRNAGFVRNLVWPGIQPSAWPELASNNGMGRSAWGARGCAAAALMASCLTVAASAQQASVLSTPAGSTAPGGQGESLQPQTGGGQIEGLQPQASGAQDDRLKRQGTTAPVEPPLSVDRIRDRLEREPVLRLDTLPLFSLTVSERRPRYWDLESPFLFEVEPRTSTTRWHDEFQAMVTPDEARMYSPMLTRSETATIAATSLLFAGAASLVKAGFGGWKQSRREGKARAAVAEVDAALAAWALANEKK
jgi:hypothetical protein